MSLINEALKKAQRARNEGQTTDAPPVPGGGTITKRGQPRSAKTIALLGGGALALVIMSVALTVYLLNRSPANAPAPASVASTPSPTTTPPATTEPKSAASVAPAPVVIAPVVTAPVKKAPEPIAAAPIPTPVDKASAPKSPATLPPIASTPTPGASATLQPAPTSPPAAAPSPPKPDERVTAFVESVRVTGIRSTGSDGRALMNGQVYRVNQIVDRTLGVKLIKVDVDSLTFADANGATYVKYF